MVGLGLVWLRAAGVGSGRTWASAAPCHGDRLTTSTMVSLPAHTQAVGIWALAARPLPAQAHLRALLAGQMSSRLCTELSSLGQGPGLSESPLPPAPSPRTRSPHTKPGGGCGRQEGWTLTINPGTHQPG